MRISESARIYDLSCYWTWMGDDGIARTKVKPLAEITLKEAKENSLAVNNLSASGSSFPLIIDATGVKSMTKEARDYFSLNNRSSKVIAFGIIVKSPISRIVGNFFMGLNKPRVPAKLFANENDAIQWAQNYLQ